MAYWEKEKKHYPFEEKHMLIIHIQEFSLKIQLKNQHMHLIILYCYT